MAHGRPRVWLLAALGGLAALGLLALAAYHIVGVGQSPSLWFGIGPVQVVGGPEEAWLFVERNTVAQTPGWGEHRALTLARRQQVVIIGRTGIKQRIPVVEGSEVTFHENLGRVFRHRDNFHLIRGPAMGWHGALFRWDKDHFTLMPRDAYDDLVRVHDVDTNIPVADRKLDELTEMSGWKHVRAATETDWWFELAEFEWAGQRFELAVERGPPLTRLLLRCGGPGALWEEPLLEFDPTPRNITWAEYNKLRSTPTIGHPK